MLAKRHPIYFKIMKHIDSMTLPSQAILRQHAESTQQVILDSGLELVPERQQIISIGDLKKALYADNMSVRADIDTGMALLFQEETGAEIGCDRITDIRRKKCFTLTTRGAPGMAVSDYLFYYIFSPQYLVQPVFHTHPECHNELGKHKPSISDFKAIYLLMLIQQADCMFDSVIFPDGKTVLYGFKEGRLVLDIIKNGTDKSKAGKEVNGRMNRRIDG